MHGFGLPTSRATHRGADFCSRPAHPLALPLPTRALAQMLELLIPTKYTEKINKKIGSFCLVWFCLVFLQATFALRSHGLEHKSDDKIINGSRAMSYLISCIFMKGATQLGPCAVGRENKEFSTPHAGHEECHCGDDGPDWKSLSDCIFILKRGGCNLWKQQENKLWVL